MKKTGLAFVLAALAIFPAAASDLVADYRFAPQWHCSTPAFPDDSCKTVVGPDGTLLYDYGGPFFPYTQNLGFDTAITVCADENQVFEGQKLMSAKVPVTITSWQCGGVDIRQAVFSVSADILESGRLVHPQKRDREDVVLITAVNHSSRTAVLSPKIIVNSTEAVSVAGREILVGKARFAFSGTVASVRTNLGPSKTVVDLESVELAPGESLSLAGLYDNAMPSALLEKMLSSPEQFPDEAEKLLENIAAYWNDTADIPYGHISVPDREIQNLIDASVRGIWQAREIRNGDISFQVGPTCYRGLWIVDGAFISETAAILGRGEEARNGIEHSLSFQKPTGEFAKLNPTFWKENGIILWTCVRHAMLTQDKEWLLSHWNELSRTVDFIHVLRERTDTTRTPLDDGLIPAGYIDGGLNGGADIPEYSNVLWNLAGLKAMVGAARWTGRTEDAEKWQDEYEDFHACFLKAAERDMAVDDAGNMYLNDIMDESQRSLPQRAQWAFCQSIYPGQLFSRGDPIAEGTLDMLDNSLQEGLVVGTGWLDDGLWNYFASFHAHASLWMGRPEKAVSSLYAFANHASPLYVWREEQMPRDRQMEFVGEMPHNWGSAEFVRLVVHLLALDRGDELHLLEGLPETWLSPGMKTSLEDIATPFGNLTFSLEVSEDGKTARLVTEPLSGECGRLVLHTGSWGRTEDGNIMALDPEKRNEVIILL